MSFLRIMAAATIVMCVSACSGVFLRQQDFDSYVKRHGLERMPIGAAIGVLERAGYVCSNRLGTTRPVDVGCEKDSRDSGRQTIVLTPSSDDPAKCVATWEPPLLTL